MKDQQLRQLRRIRRNAKRVGDGIVALLDSVAKQLEGDNGHSFDWQSLFNQLASIDSTLALCVDLTLNMLDESPEEFSDDEGSRSFPDAQDFATEEDYLRAVKRAEEGGASNAK